MISPIRGQAHPHKGRRAVPQGRAGQPLGGFLFHGAGERAHMSPIYPCTLWYNENAFFRSDGMQEKIVDLGGHGEEFILKDNVGCPMK